MSWFLNDCEQEVICLKKQDIFENEQWFKLSESQERKMAVETESISYEEYIEQKKEKGNMLNRHQPIKRAFQTRVMKNSTLNGQELESGKDHLLKNSEQDESYGINFKYHVRFIDSLPKWETVIPSSVFLISPNTNLSNKNVSDLNVHETFMVDISKVKKKKWDKIMEKRDYKMCSFENMVYLVNGTDSSSVTSSELISYDKVRNVAFIWKNAIIRGLPIQKVIATRDTLLFFSAKGSHRNKLRIFRLDGINNPKQMYQYDESGYIQSSLRILNETDIPHMSDFAAELVGRFLYVFGGKSRSNGQMAIYKINTSSGEVVEINAKGQYPESRKFHNATYLWGKIYVSGGEKCKEALNDFHCFDIESEEWEDMECKDQCPPPALSGHLACETNDGMMIIGGKYSENALGSWYKFDPELNRWFVIVNRTPPKISSILHSSNCIIWGHDIVQILHGKMNILRNGLSQDKENTLLSHISKFRKDETFSDLILRAMSHRSQQYSEYKVHQCIISARCPLLYEYIKKKVDVLGMEENTPKMIPICNIEECSAEALEMLLDYIYSCQFSVKSTKEKYEFIAVSNKWYSKEISDLVQDLCEHPCLDRVHIVMNHFSNDLAAMKECENSHPDLKLYACIDEIQQIYPMIIEEPCGMEKEYILGHRVILSRSPLLRTMLTSSLSEGVENELPLTNCTTQTLNQVLVFLYTGDCEISSSNVVEIMFYSSLLDLKELVDKCYLFLEAYFADPSDGFAESLKNAIELVQIAILYNEKPLKNTCVRYLSNHYGEAQKMEEYWRLDSEVRDKVVGLACLRWRRSKKKIKKQQTNEAF